MWSEKSGKNELLLYDKPDPGPAALGFNNIVIAH